MENNEAYMVRLKQLRFRSHHRGVNEMDQLLGHFGDTQLVGLTAAQLEAYGQLLDAPDWDSYAWVTGQGEPPQALAAIVALIQETAKTNP